MFKKFILGAIKKLFKELIQELIKEAIEDLELIRDKGKDKKDV